MPIQTIPQIIADAQISLYLATIDVQSGTLFPKPLNKTSPSVIYTEMKSVEWAYNQNNNFQNISATSNYLYWLCAAYNLQAIYIIANGGGGVIPPITPPVPNGNARKWEFEISDSSPIPANSSTYTFNIAPYNYTNYDLNFFRNGALQPQFNNGSAYYTWNPITAMFQCFPAAQAGEIFTFQPDF